MSGTTRANRKETLAIRASSFVLTFAALHLSLNCANAGDPRTPLPDGRVHQLRETSEGNGATWATPFDACYSKMK
jgi:hypothetical protein